MAGNNHFQGENFPILWRLCSEIELVINIHLLIIILQVQRGVIVIPKSVNPKRIEENFDVFNFCLSDDDMKLLNSMDLWYSERKGRYVDLAKLWKGPDGNLSPHYPFDIEF